MRKYPQRGLLSAVSSLPESDKQQECQEGPVPKRSQFVRVWNSVGKVCISRVGYLSLHLNYT